MGKSAAAALAMGRRPACPYDWRVHAALWLRGQEAMEEDAEGYSASPYAAAQALLEDNAEHETELGEDVLEWRKGGAMDKLTNKPLKTCRAVQKVGYSFARECLFDARLRPRARRHALHGPQVCA